MREASTGVTVRATTLDAATASTYDSASGLANAPPTPLRTTMGATAGRTTSVAKKAGLRTAAVASTTTSPADRWSAECRPSCSPRRRSTAITTSSTMTPIATASPATTIMLKDAPRRSSTQMAAISDSTIDTALINATRQERKYRPSSTETATRATSADRPALPHAASTKLAGR